MPDSAGAGASAPEAITGDRRSRKRGRGWDFLHVCVDDASRLAYTEIMPDERKASAVTFLGHALAWFAGLGVTVARHFGRPSMGRGPASAPRNGSRAWRRDRTCDRAAGVDIVLRDVEAGLVVHQPIVQVRRLR